jgi:hypothetical protein
MPRKIHLFLLLSAFLLTMCKTYDAGGLVVSANGLSCQNFADYGFLTRKEGAECFYVCPDGTVSQPAIEENFSTSSQLYSASKEEVDAQYCSVNVQPTATKLPVSTPTSPPPTLVTTSASITPTTLASTALASPTVEAVPTSEAQTPLLTGDVPMCDIGGNLMNLRIVQPTPDLTGKTLTVQIADVESTCTVNPVNTSLLSCTIPPGLTFPASIVVTLDGAIVNDFIFDGLGCAKLTTPIPVLNSTITP